MNKVILLGNVVRDPEVRYAANDSGTAIARFSLAVRKRYKKDGEADADFLNIVAFGRNAEFSEKYLKKGAKIGLVGHIQTGSYVNKDGQKVYTTDIIMEEVDFAGSNHVADENSNTTPATQAVPEQTPAKAATPDFSDTNFTADEDIPFN